MEKPDESRIQKIKALDDIQRGLKGLREQHLIYQFLLDEAVKALRAQNGTFFVLDPGMASLIPKASVGFPLDKLKLLPFKYGVGICGWVAHNEEPVIINDVAHDHRYNKFYDKQTGYNTQSILCCPMQIRRDLMGIIELFNHAEHRFGPDDLTFLKILSSYASAALESAV